MSKLIRRLPNCLTFLRLALIPVFVVLLIEPTQATINAAIGIFIFAALTDYLDGWIARAYQAETDFGKLLDPLADKILVIAALVMLVSMRSELYAEPWVPGWMVVLVVAREIWVTGLRGVAAERGIIVAASAAGKVKSGLQMVAIVFLLLHDASFSFWAYEITCQFVGVNFLFLSIIFSYWGAVDYTWAVFYEEKQTRSTD